MRYRRMVLASSIAAFLLSASATANEQDPDPEQMADDAWVSLTGTVESVRSDQFMLDYGEGEITVEMDDWDSVGEAFPLNEGDEVTVYGEVDAGLYQDSRIEASSVHVKGLNTFFYASAADEEDLGEWVVDIAVGFGDLTYVGTVQSVSSATDSFTIGTDGQEVTVFTAKLPYNPLDDEGFQQIEPGDRVSVNGQVSADFFGDADLFADSVVTLSNGSPQGERE